MSLYLETKLEDLRLATPECLSDAPPFVDLAQAAVRCPTFEELGFCPQGLKCRFLSAHFTREGQDSSAGRLIVDDKRWEEAAGKDGRELNCPDQAVLRDLRSNRVCLSLTSRAFIVSSDHLLVFPSFPSQNPRRIFSASTASLLHRLR